MPYCHRLESQVFFMWATPSFWALVEKTDEKFEFTNFGYPPYFIEHLLNRENNEMIDIAE